MCVLRRRPQYKEVVRWSKLACGSGKGLSQGVEAKATDVVYRVGRCDRIVIPVNSCNLHWTCAIIDLEAKKLVYLDSLHQPTNKVSFPTCFATWTLPASLTATSGGSCDMKDVMT